MTERVEGEYAESSFSLLRSTNQEIQAPDKVGTNATRPLPGWSSGEGGAEEGKHAVAGEVGEGGEFEGVVAAGEFEGARVGAVAS